MVRVEIITVFLVLGLIAAVAGTSVNLNAGGPQCCKVHGDPHVKTFDGNFYDYMGTGTFILAQDKWNQRWRVYGTFKPCGARHKKLTCIVSITVIFDGESLQFLRMYRINYKGKSFKVAAGTSKNVGQINVAHMLMKYKIGLGSTGVTVYWDGITVSQICVTDGCQGGVEGICGNNDCLVKNEFLPYKTSTEFANTWVVTTKKQELEPAVLPRERTDPCRFIMEVERMALKARCNAVLTMSYFRDCVGSSFFNKEVFMQHCMFDSCAGLTLGAGCPGNKDGTCKKEQDALVYEAVARGMTELAARAQLIPKSLDPACLAGIALSKECEDNFVIVNSSWRHYLQCPDDKQIKAIKMCP